MYMYIYIYNIKYYYCSYLYHCGIVVAAKVWPYIVTVTCKAASGLYDQGDRRWTTSIVARTSHSIRTRLCVFRLYPNSIPAVNVQNRRFSDNVQSFQFSIEAAILLTNGISVLKKKTDRLNHKIIISLICIILMSRLSFKFIWVTISINAIYIFHKKKKYM